MLFRSLEVLAFYSQEPESILSVEEIQSGIPFRLVKNTSLFFFQGTDENTISYRRSGRIVTEQISIEQLKLLEIFKSAKTVDEFSAAMENFIEDPIVIQQHISEWIKNKIIVCERITK